ncbi:bleomycin resistance protein [Salsipaludibacter albus]|uniref:bleomycin resistance protein n=1 Tax=Salsipaludibacter albus TaxID=2849650 RepID=UPI001EE3C8E4|nr:VOC family protein [Salsipaludibacter albus]
MHRRGVVRAVQPELPVADLERAMAFHRLLGFDVEAHEGGGYAFVTDRGREVWHLRQVADLADGGSRAGLYAHVKDPHALHDRFVALGASPTPVVVEPWGMREFSVTDPDGNRLRFGTNAPT